MGFWGGLFIGLFTGANIGVVVAALLAGAKRDESSEESLLHGLQVDQAVMDDTPVKYSQAARPLVGGSENPDLAV